MSKNISSLQYFQLKMMYWIIALTTTTGHQLQSWKGWANPENDFDYFDWGHKEERTAKTSSFFFLFRFFTSFHCHSQPWRRPSAESHNGLIDVWSPSLQRIVLHHHFSCLKVHLALHPRRLNSFRGMMGSVVRHPTQPSYWVSSASWKTCNDGDWFEKPC